MYDVFISYSRKDKKIVEEFCTILSQVNISYWLDKDGIENGDDFKTIIVKAIEDSAVFLFFSSTHSNNSIWTAKEIGIAVARGKQIIPIKLDTSSYAAAVEFDLVNLDFVDYTDSSTREVAIKKLIAAIKSKSVDEIEETIVVHPKKKTKYFFLCLLSLLLVSFLMFGIIYKKGRTIVELNPKQIENCRKLEIADSLLKEQKNKIYKLDGINCYDSIDCKDLIGIKKRYDEIEKHYITDTLDYVRSVTEISQLIDSTYIACIKAYSFYSDYKATVAASKFKEKAEELQNHINIKLKNK